MSLFRYFDFRVTAGLAAFTAVTTLSTCRRSIGNCGLPSKRRTTSLKVRSCTREQISAARRECYTVRYGDLMSSGDSVIVKNPNILSGTPVFRGTRVPLQLLFDSLERGHTLEEFVEGYPTVSREMAVAALEEAQQLLSAQA